MISREDENGFVVPKEPRNEILGPIRDVVYDFSMHS